MNPKTKVIYSYYFEKLIPVGFTVDDEHYTWSEEDLVYWSDEIDGDCYMEVPTNADLDLK